MNEQLSIAGAGPRESHLDWLRSERAAFELHEASMGEAPTARDFAVGSSDSFVNLDDEEPVYRSMSLAGPHEGIDDIYDEEPVYRSLNFRSLSVEEAPPESASPAIPAAPAAHASWAAQKRPPLLRRQNAFVCRDMDSDLMGMLQSEPGQ